MDHLENHETFFPKQSKPQTNETINKPKPTPVTSHAESPINVPGMTSAVDVHWVTEVFSRSLAESGHAGPGRLGKSKEFFFCFFKAIEVEAG